MITNVAGGTSTIYHVHSILYSTLHFHLLREDNLSIIANIIMCVVNLCVSETPLYIYICEHIK